MDWQPDGVVTYYNDRLSLFHGAHRLADGTWQWAGLLHEKDLPATRESWAEALRTGQQYQAEHRIMMADKSYRWHLSRALPQKDAEGRVAVWYGTATDIHDLKSAEEEIRRKEKRLRASENNFKRLAHSLPQMIWTCSQPDNPDFFNQTWLEYTGMPENGAGRWKDFFHPDDRAVLESVLMSSPEGSGMSASHDVRIRGRSGVYSWFNLHATPLFDESGSFTKLIGTLTNIDLRKENEEQLRMLVQQQTQELQRSNQDLSQFAHITSHDLKEPLRKIISFGLRLEDELGQDIPEKARLYLSKIHGAASRLSAMVDGILQYSQADAFASASDQIDMNILLSEILADVELVIAEKGATITYDSLIPVRGIRVLIRQLFYNLINNALKFSNPGQPPVIVIRSQPAGDPAFAQYEISDNGIGFPRQYADRIFETFYRLNSKDRFEGTGLGLALCRKIAVRHGGSIQADSDGSSGSTFTVILPAAASD